VGVVLGDQNIDSLDERINTMKKYAVQYWIAELGTWITMELFRTKKAAESAGAYSTIAWRIITVMR
jgi:hypothetical protein